jgi:hypothetical protein
LLLPAGFSVIVVAAGLATMRDETAELAVPFVVGLTLAGFGLSLRWRRARIDWWALAAALGVYAVFAAPVVVSGEATFAGYIKLDDTSTWLAMTDHVMEHGRSLAGLAPSSYEATLDGWLGGGYPVGSFLTLGIGHELLGQDSAWLYQPYIAFLAALLALASYSLVEPLIRTRPVRALVVFVASQSALLYGYSLWGGVKELATAPIVALVAALAASLISDGSGTRRVLPLATATAATLAIVSLGGGIWLLPVLVVAVVLALTLPLRGFASRAAAFAGFTALMSLPALAVARTFLDNLRSGGVLRLESELGNLVEPLNSLQVFGVWPTGDFRGDPDELELTYVLIGLVAAAGVTGLAWAWRRRSPGLPLYVGAATIGAAVSWAAGSPWVDAKAITIASPAFLLAALAGLAVFFEQGRRVEATLAAAAVAGGVLWSNLLAYHDVWLAPRDKLVELEQIGDRIAGQGPTLMTEFQPYGVRHFLREADPEGAGELRRRQVPLRDGTLLDKGSFADIDEFQLDGLLAYRMLVLRRSPLVSRPPSPFRIAWQGRYYEIWQRRQRAPRVIEHVPLGDGTQPVATPSCGAIQRLAQRARPGGVLATVLRSRATVIPLSDSGLVYPNGSFRFVKDVDLPVGGRYRVWIGNEFRGKIDVFVNGQKAGEARHQLKPDQFSPLREVELTAGRQRVRVHYGGPDLHPGSGGRPWFGLGPLVLSRSTAERPVVYVGARNAGALCGRSLDWIEVIGS